ncbi:CRISPR-associated helicase Cas3' [Herbidospora sp. NEAU-GS84]|uniref:CRISPR-associated helicase Cas3 n=1 Tax=Herbidospora solisilvae TaxID=2696284 RepID=A0A7C9NG67_9ACTN|nr:CRISPR-associated helicase Cas3' [Herbidospora solisilvae]NAS22178.1 CRISPR-associated helicase Cas3' [Herbidospora solisilvae]
MAVPPISEDVDLDLWGKSKGLLKPYPLICHLLDTSAMTFTLWDDYVSSGLRKYITTSLGVDDGGARKLLAFWAGLHDIGKAIPCFQMMDESAYENLHGYPSSPDGKNRHEFATHASLGAALKELGYDARRAASSAFIVAQLLGGHHGRFSPRDPNECRYPPTRLFPEFGSGKWDLQRSAILHAVERIVGSPPPPASVPAECAALLCGIVILADWLVSQENHLVGRLTHLPRTPDDLPDHFKRSLQISPSLLRDAGLFPVRLRPAAFADEFPQIPQPNDLQNSISTELPGLVGSGPGILLITAPMGEGKTEAAFHGARLLGTSSGSPGFFFALPTMATADQMYGRARAYAERQADNDSALTLLHSMSWLNEAYTATGDADPAVLADVAAPEWLHGRKRGLLASMAVGTVDQALLAALPLKHMPLRTLGLAGKVLVVDEVHAYDAYMQALLNTALTWLGHLRVPVVLMSATLPRRIARRLVGAYLRGSGHPDADLPEIPYPGWAYADAATGQVTPFEVAADARELQVGHHLVPVGSDGVERFEALRELLAPLVDEGGCAAMICNTVAEAQLTYRMLADWFEELGGEPPELILLHARFPARCREELTREIISKYGRCRSCPTLEKCFHRPRKSVLVATQVIEQSLDLDFDLMVSDLAPIALLLQRAGRCWRHHRANRPSWATEPRLAVLRPTGDNGKLRLPKSWPFVYPRSLLRRTDETLPDGVIAIPGDVQKLVEQVYDDSFADGDAAEEDIEWLAAEMAETGLAEMVAIDTPGNIRGLHTLTSAEVDEELISTRLGAESVRVLCAYRDPAGRLFLDPAYTRPLPTGPKLPRAVVKEILAETIPLRASLVRGRDERNAPPPGWGDNLWLRDLVVIPLQETKGFDSPAGQAGDQIFVLDPKVGLMMP